MINQKKQQGIALIFVMMIFTFIATISAAIFVITRVNVVKQGTYLHYQQAKYYALSAEQYIAMLLQPDEHEKQSDYVQLDHWFSKWADDHKLTIDNVALTVQVIDEQALFNINRLKNNQQKNQADDEFYVLLTQLFDSDAAQRIIDWKTENTEISESEKSPVNLKSGEFTNVSELKIDKILSSEEYKKLRPYITALPGQTKWNMNTIPRELMAIVFPELAEEDIEEVIQVRSNIGFQKLEDLKALPVFSNEIAWDNLDIGLASQYFSVYIKAVYNNTTYYLHSMLYRNHKGNVSVIQREEGEYPKWISVLRRSMREL
ncbi:MAG: type II secretion system minor pseudopilin GspK [Endozoicomonadaceae bacterium]|nr:type II secretion system minor pseudopilin GspK [Endozoicomonadaceae bacterium]